MNSTVKTMCLRKTLVSSLLLLVLLSFLCACDRTAQPDESVTHGSEVTESRPSESETEATSESETEATSGSETENETESDTEEGSETETVSGRETDTAPDTPDTPDEPAGSDEETTSPVVELPKVEFD